MIKSSNGQKGFTIIELLIATSVLAVILLVTTFVLIGIGNLYYKGVSEARVQATTRNIANDLVQDIRNSDATSITTSSQTYTNLLNGSAMVTVKSLCINSIRYSYDTSASQIGSQIRHVVWRDTSADPSTCKPLDITQPTPTLVPLGPGIPGSELMGADSLLMALTISSLPPYQIQVAAAYGNASELDHTPPTFSTLCTLTQGNQYCATAAEQTVAVPRL